MFTNDKKTYKIFKSKVGLLKIDMDLISFLNEKEVNFYTDDDNNTCIIFSEFNDFLGVSIVEKFNMSELLQMLEM